jgi:hypothetical protein
MAFGKLGQSGPRRILARTHGRAVRFRLQRTRMRRLSAKKAASMQDRRGAKLASRDRHFGSVQRPFGDLTAQAGASIPSAFTLESNA